MLDVSDVRVGLFIPATSERFTSRAHERGADAIVLDLEDSIPPSDKARGREALAAGAALLRARGLTVFARVNADDRLLDKDIEAVVAAGVECLLVPKQVSVESVLRAANAAERAERKAGVQSGSTGLLAIIESPAGVMNAQAIATAHPRMRGMVFGSEDYCASLGVASAQAQLEWPAQRVALVARACGLGAYGVPGSISTLAGAEVFVKLARKARGMGFTGAFCVHPTQIEFVRRGFAPTAAEIEDARAVLSAARENGEAAFAFAGRMVDAPMLAWARRLLAQAHPHTAAPPPEGDE